MWPEAVHRTITFGVPAPPKTRNDRKREIHCCPHVPARSQLPRWRVPSLGRHADSGCPVATAIVVSLILTPLAAIGWAHLVGLRGPALQAGVLQSSMPTAVMTTILALEFDAKPEFVTSVVCIATLLSPLTVTVLIAYLQSG
jgi:hypothetical protein